MSPKMNNLPEDCADNINTFLRRHCISPKMNNLPDDCVSNILKFLRPVRQKENKKQPLASAMFNSYTYTDLMCFQRPRIEYIKIQCATNHLKYAKDKKPIVVEMMVGQYYKSNKKLYSWYVNNAKPREIKKVPTTETVIQNPIRNDWVNIEIDNEIYRSKISKICSKTIHIQCHYKIGEFGVMFAPGNDLRISPFRCIARRV